jgi:hypothetical protein
MVRLEGRSRPPPWPVGQRRPAALQETLSESFAAHRALAAVEAEIRGLRAILEPIKSQAISLCVIEAALGRSQ